MESYLDQINTVYNISYVSGIAYLFSVIGISILDDERKDLAAIAERWPILKYLFVFLLSMIATRDSKTSAILLFSFIIFSSVVSRIADSVDDGDHEDKDEKLEQAKPKMSSLGKI